MSFTSDDRAGEPSRAALALALIAYTIALALYFAVVEGPGRLQPDMAEAYAWGREFQLGYNQHPPFWAWIAGAWFGFMPHEIWAFGLLSAINAALGVAGAYAASGHFLKGDGRVAALALTAITPCFSLMAFKYNANVIFISLWPWTLYAFLNALSRRRLTDSLALGALAGCSLLSKYSALAPLAILALATLLAPEGRRYWRSASPWISAVVAAALFLPHAVWLLMNGAPPLKYLATQSGLGAAPLILNALESALGALGMAAPAALAVAWLSRGTLRPKALFRPRRRCEINAWFPSWPDLFRPSTSFRPDPGEEWRRRSENGRNLRTSFRDHLPGGTASVICKQITGMTWTSPVITTRTDSLILLSRLSQGRLLLALAVGPLVLTFVLALALRTRIYPQMLVGLFPLWPTLLMALVDPIDARTFAKGAKRLAAAAIVAALVLAAPVSFATARLSNRARDVTPYREAAETAERLWREHTDAPLVYVGGARAFDEAAAFYSPSRPHALVNLDYSASLWVKPADIAEHGLLILCPEDDEVCLKRADELASKNAWRVRAALTHSAWGGEARAYGLLIIGSPGRPSANWQRRISKQEITK